MGSFTVVIPARLASSRLERKALADLGGKPMVIRVAERSAQSAANRIIVATDAQEDLLRLGSSAKHLQT